MGRLAALGAVLVLAGMPAAACGAGLPSGGPRAEARVPAAPLASYTPTSRSSLIAQIVRPTLAHTAARGSARVRARIVAQADWARGPVGLMVLGARRAHGRLWLKVALPSRPNGASPGRALRTE